MKSIHFKVRNGDYKDYMDGAAIFISHSSIQGMNHGHPVMLALTCPQTVIFEPSCPIILLVCSLA